MDWLHEALNFLWLAAIGVLGYIMKRINKNSEDIQELREQVTKSSVLNDVASDDIKELRKDIHEMRDLLIKSLNRSG